MTISTVKINQLPIYFITLCFSFNSLASETNEDSDGFIIFAALNKNEYIGSNDKEVVPALISTFNLFGSETSIEGLTARTELYSHNNWHAGLAAQFDFGRADDVTNKTISSMKAIESNISLGGYLSYTNHSIFLADDSLELRVQAVHDASNEHNGTLSTITSSYTLPLMLPWRIEFELESSFADKNYMDSFFGISQSDSLASGLSKYQANSGFMEISFNTNILLFSSSQWGTYMRLGYSRLLSESSNSPLVKEQGNKNQSQVGLGIFYQF